MKNHRSVKKYVVCVKNKDYETSLERLKIYRVLVDKEAEGKGLFRIVDESRQSYLYPQVYFVSIKFPLRVLRTLDRAA
ncbi:MAG: hypothetical protein HYS07_00725 [Chlamydiae bacterium]|nr:hypothetical protein [Chlamydiota bacterium]MBI3278048.1 hypothetical protein [Chlamydiota bacterium]